MNILIVGLGSIARKHISAIYSVHPNAKIFALRHSGKNRVEGVENVFSKDKIGTLGIDFAVISNPTAEHYHTIEWLRNFNFPLFIEKPLFDKIQPFSSVNVLTYVACNLRFLGCLQWVKEHINSKRINEANVYCGSYLPLWREGADWRSVYSANKDMGGGVHIDLIHEIDYIYWLFGRSINICKVLRNVSSLDISAVDYANYCLIYPSFSVSIVLNYYRRDYKRTLELVFEDVTWNVDLAANKVLCGDEVLFQGEVGMANTYIDQMQYFIDLVQCRANKSMNSLEEAYEVLKICL